MHGLAFHFVASVTRRPCRWSIATLWWPLRGKLCPEHVLYYVFHLLKYCVLFSFTSIRQSTYDTRYVVNFAVRPFLLLCFH